MNELFEAMDFVTSDEYLHRTGDEYFWQKHANIITEHFNGDWSWTNAIKYWSKKDQQQALKIYQAAQV